MTKVVGATFLIGLAALLVGCQQATPLPPSPARAPNPLCRADRLPSLSPKQEYVALKAALARLVALGCSRAEVEAKLALDGYVPLYGIDDGRRVLIDYRHDSPWTFEMVLLRALGCHGSRAIRASYDRRGVATRFNPVIAGCTML